MAVITDSLKLNHLNLPARDPEKLANWYAEKLGFRKNGRFLWSGGTLLVFSKAPPLNSPATHFGFRVESLETLSAWVDRLRADGIDVPDIEGDQTYSTVFVDDPEGNKFEIFYELPPADS